MNKGAAIRMPAEWASDCRVCVQKIKPGDNICLEGRGVGRRPGMSSHDGCIWDDRHGPCPHLTWLQLEGLLRAIHGAKLPDDRRVDRLLGAATKRHKQRTLVDRETDAALALGPDLLAAYRMVLKATGKHKETWWRPRHSNGTTLWENPEKTQPAERPRMTGQDLQGRIDKRVAIALADPLPLGASRRTIG